jgi:hypothetical protein
LFVTSNFVTTGIIIGVNVLNTELSSENTLDNNITHLLEIDNEIEEKIIKKEKIINDKGNINEKKKGNNQISTLTTFPTISPRFSFIDDGSDSGEAYHYIDQKSNVDSFDDIGITPDIVNLQNIDSNYTNITENLNLLLDLNVGRMEVATQDVTSPQGTISFWVKHDTFGTRVREFGADANMELRRSGDSKILDWGSDTTMITSSTFSPGIWYFIAITWNENSNDLFFYSGTDSIEPVLDSNSLSESWTGGISAITQSVVYWGEGKGATGAMDGKMDDIRYYNIDRSLNDILKDYNKSLTGLESNLVNYYKLDGDYTDSAGGDNGSLVGSGQFIYDFDKVDSEFQFTNIAYFLSHKTLAVKTGNFYGTENIELSYWSGSGWIQLTPSLSANTWNNYTMQSSDSYFTIKFSDTIIDSTVDSWELDGIILHLSGVGSLDYPVTSDNSNIDSMNDLGEFSGFENLNSADNNSATFTETNIFTYDIDFIDSSSDRGSSETATIDKPNNTQINDFMIAILVSTRGSDNDGSAMSSFPSGWILEQDYTISAASGLHVYIYHKFAGTSEPSSYSWSWANEEIGWVGQIATFRNVDQTNPISVTGSVNQLTTNSPLSPAVTTTEDKTMVWLYEVNDNDVNPITGGNPTNTIQIGVDQRNSPGNGIGLITAYYTHPIAGSTGDKQWYLNAIEETASQQIALLPLSVPIQAQIDKELQWKNLTTYLKNESLAIKTGSFNGSENIIVEFWNGTNWQLLISNLVSNSWNNISINEYLNSSTFSIRFKDENSSLDSIIDSWLIDVVVIHVKNPDTVSPTIESFGVEDLGTGLGIFWVNITDNSLKIKNVTILVDSINYSMVYNGSFWIYQQNVNYGETRTYRIISVYDFSDNFISASENNYTFNLVDNSKPEIISAIYEGNNGYNGTFVVNASDWGIIDIVLVNITSCECIPSSSTNAILRFNGTYYVNDSILMESGLIFFDIIINDTAGNSFTLSQSGVVENKAPTADEFSITSNPFTKDSIIASWTFFDIDGDIESSIINITWYKNDVIQPVYNNLTTIPSSATVKYEKWYYIVQVFDGQVFSVSYNSSDYMVTATVINSLPVLSNVKIENQNPYTDKTRIHILMII